MIAHSKQLSKCQTLIELIIELPYCFLIEQINLYVDQVAAKLQSTFSQSYQLVSVGGDESELALKSAYSECVTKSGKIEYNVVGVAQRLKLIFSQELNSLPIHQSDIEVQVQQQAASIEHEDRILAQQKLSIDDDDDEDYRILNSLPGIQNSTNSKLQKLLKSIEIVGFNMNQVPAITNLTYFMNQSCYLLSKGREFESHQIEFMTSQLLVTTKRATQATEMYRKMQIRTLKNVKQSNPIAKHESLIKCAVYELLIADSLSPTQQLIEKIQSISRLVLFLKAEIPKDINQRFASHISISKIDAFSSMIQNLPLCLRFTIACLSHKVEIVRISALKMIKYILETIGCSLDYGIVFILKSMLQTYPVEGQQQSYCEGDFDLKRLFSRDISIVEYLFKLKKNQTTKQTVPTKWLTLDEPQSGSKRAMINIYNNVLDTYISVLSSVSSHLLHSIFYDVIEKSLVIDSQQPVEVRIFNCKIADKIFTICQGDLILTPKLLDTLVQLSSNTKAQLPDSLENSALTQIKGLWLSIRQKVLPNYSEKGFCSLVNWLVQRLTNIKGTEGSDDQVRQMAEIITIVALGRQKSEEESNQLIKLPSYEKYGGSTSSELYLVLAPLLYWLEYSIDREERFPMFTSIYQAVKDVLSGLPKGQSDLDIISVIFPSLRRASDFMVDNSPSISMIKFLDLVLTDINRYYSKNKRTQPPIDIQQFFLELLLNFVVYIPYSLYEEVISVFEKLIALCPDVFTDKAIQSCIIALIDKYTVKSKQLKTATLTFMKFLLSPPASLKQQNQQGSPNSLLRSEGIEELLAEGGLDYSISNRSSYFDMMSEICFYSNQFGKSLYEHESTDKQLEFRSQSDLSELNLSKLQFFIDCLTLMNENHISMFTNLITHPSFRNCLLDLIGNDESNIRLKAHEIMDNLTQYFVQYCPSKTVYEFTSGTGKNETMEAEFISHERLYISQIVISVVKLSFKNTYDCYMQFNSLILLDFLFQNLLPVPTFQNELLKSKRNKKEGDSADGASEITLDVEILSISEATPELDVMEPAYLKMRLKLVQNMWPYVQAALNSPWSNIRSICYGLICSMIRIDVSDYITQTDNINQDETIQELQSIVLPMLHSLLSSKESESKAGGLNILGSFCGLSYDFSNIRVNKQLAFFQRNSNFVSYYIWKLVWQLQDDWDVTIKEASVVLIQLCAPRQAILFFESLKESKELAKLDYLLNMQKVSEVYFKNEIKDLPDCDVMSEYAKRAVALFPSQDDCNSVLFPEQMDSTYNLSFSHSNTKEPVSFEEFMFSREISFPTEMISIAQILEINEELTLIINDFNPNFEDIRFTQGQGEIQARRNQFEIDIGFQNEIESNFFVDSYNDDQIQEIISIFRNDFKPPKSLWIEKQPQYKQVSHPQQPPVSQSPDFYQDIYSEAIEQLNQHQIMMQQKQQDELQQQVSGGIPTQSSVSSQDSFSSINQLKDIIETVQNDSQNSSTPSPTNFNTDVQKESVTYSQTPKPAVAIQHQPIFAGTWPTSPVLVSSKTNNFSSFAKQTQLQVEQLNFEDMTVLSQSEDEDDPPIEIKQISQQNQQSKLPQHLKLDSEEHLQDQIKSQAQLNQQNLSDSEHIKLLSKNSPKNKKKKGDQSQSTSNQATDHPKISKKTALTYLQNLNQGYIQSFDNIKLLNTCFGQQTNSITNNHQLNNTTINVPKKLSIKTVHQNDNGMATSRNNKKKQTISNSPDNQPRKTSKPATKKLTQKSIQQTTKQMNNLADLNYFIKSLEKGLTNPTTPSSLKKKVEEQMRAFGVDPKVWSKVEQQEMRKSEGRPLPPQMKLLALNSIVKSEEQLTPSNQTLKRLNNQLSQSPKRLGCKSNSSDSDINKTQKLNEKKQVENLSGHCESNSHERDNQSSGKITNGSYAQLQQPAILTERSLSNQQVLFGFKNHSLGKQSNSTRYDSAGLFQFKKGNSKSQKKGYSALASKSIMSPTTLKRDNLQSGSLVQNKLNLSANQIQTTKIAASTLKKQSKINSKSNILQDLDSKTATSSQRQPQSTRNQVQEQGGDRSKQHLSPDQTSGANKQQKKKRSGNSHNNLSGLSKPSLVLQQPSYY